MDKKYLVSEKTDAVAKALGWKPESEKDHPEYMPYFWRKPDGSYLGFNVRLEKDDTEVLNALRELLKERVYHAVFCLTGNSADIRILDCLSDIKGWGGVVSDDGAPVAEAICDAIIALDSKK